MQHPEATSENREQRLERVIAEFLDDLTQGRPRNRNDLLDAHPDLGDELRQFLDNHDCVQQFADSWRLNAGLGSDGRSLGTQFSAQRDTTTSEVATGDLPRGDGLTVSLSHSGPRGAINSPTAATCRFGDYELLHEIARGGMGIIYKARQLSLNRIVAIKMILRRHLEGSEEIERFNLEAKATAKLKHPHILVIHDVGQCDEQHFFSMEYVEGHSLAQLIRRGPIPVRRAAEYVEQVAKAADFAHQNGIVHRDIKPSNVLIDETGRARVTDFGLAKHVDRGDELTLSGEILGTPAYMAPEQITNRRGEIGPACDVYALGVLLYELLTGRAPFKGRDHFETLLHVLECDPQSPRQVNPDIPRELEMICLKCLEKDPKHRYASAAAAADDLAHYLAGDSISLTSPRLADKLVRTLERSHYDREIHTWSRMLVHLTWISLATHVLVFLNHWLEPAQPLFGLVAIRAFEVVGMGVVLWWFRSQWYPPCGAPARQLLSLWLGYMAGTNALVVIAYLATPSGRTFDDFLAYPPMAVLASLLFIMLGSSYWGYCYLIGAVFLTLALGMSFFLGIAPLLFGAAWATSLSLLSLRLGRLAGNR